MYPSVFPSPRYILVHLDDLNIEFSATFRNHASHYIYPFIFYGNISKSRFMLSDPIIYHTSYFLLLAGNLFLFAKFCIKFFSSKPIFLFHITITDMLKSCENILVLTC